MTGVSEALTERMIALVRHAARSASGHTWEEANRIVAELPVQVDPDLVEARKVAVSNSRWESDGDQFASVLAGKQDHIPMVKCALAAIKRGRELAQVQS